MIEDRIIRLKRSAGAWFIAKYIFDVYNDYNTIRFSSFTRDEYFIKLFSREGKNYSPSSLHWRIYSIMKLVREGDIYFCLDSIILSKNKTKAFATTKQNAVNTKNKFIEKFGSKMPRYHL